MANKISQFPMLLSLLIILNLGCKKDVSLDSSKEFTTSLKSSLTNYLDSVYTTQSGFLIIKSSEIPWNEMEYRKINDNKILVYIPVRKTSINNSNKGLVAIVNSSNQKAQTLFYVNISYDLNGNSNNTPNKSSFETLYNYYSKSEKHFLGKIQFISLENSLMYEYGYSKTKNSNYFKAISPDVSSASQEGIKKNNCTAYYLVTTYADGTSDRLYLFTECDDTGASGGSGCNELTSIGIPNESVGYIKNLCAVRGGGGTTDLATLIVNDNKYSPVTITKNSDGTKTCVLYSGQGLPIFSNAKIVFTLNANNRIIFQPTLVISGLIGSFAQEAPQDPNSVDVIYGESNMIFTIKGVLTMFGGIGTAFRTDVEVKILYPGSALEQIVAKPTYGYSLNGGRTYLN